MRKFNDEEIKSIMIWLGYKSFTLGYVGDSETETEFQRQNQDYINKLNLWCAGDYFVRRGDIQYFKSSDLKWEDDSRFHSWDWFMEIAKKLDLDSLPTKKGIAISILRKQLKLIGAL